MAAWDWVRKNSTKKLHPNNNNNNHHNNQSHNNNHSKQHSDDNLTDLQNNNDIIELLNGWRNEKKQNQNNASTVLSPTSDTFQLENSRNNKVNLQQREELDNILVNQNIQLQPAPKIHNHKHKNTNNKLISKFENESASNIKQNIIPYDKNQSNLNVPQSESSLTTPNSDFSYNEQNQIQSNGTNDSSFYQSANSSHSSIEKNSYQTFQQPLNSKFPNKKLDFQIDNLKEEIILDLGLPRNKRGSNLSELTHIDPLCNEYNDEIAKQYYSKPRPLIKPTTRLSPSQASSRLKNLNINVGSGKSTLPQVQLQSAPQPSKSHCQTAMKEFNKRTTSQRSPMRLNFQASSTTQKQKILNSDDISYSSNQKLDCKIPQTPSKVSNPFYKRQHNAINKFNNKLTESTNSLGSLDNIDNSSEHKNIENNNSMNEKYYADSPVSVSRNSSITSKLSNLDSPINPTKESELISSSKKPVKFDVCRSNAPSVYIYNNCHAKNNKNVEGKDKLKFNRTSSVYALEPVEDFKNIDINENPLPSIGNLLSSTEETFTIPDNPYALDTFNPYEYSK